MQHTGRASTPGPPEAVPERVRTITLSPDSLRCPRCGVTVVPTDDRGPATARAHTCGREATCGQEAGQDQDEASVEARP